MKDGQSGLRGVFWREHPAGSQEQRLPGGKVRGDWWIRWTCRQGHLYREKIGPRSLAAEQYASRKLRVRTENYCLTGERERRARAERPLLLRALLDLVRTDYEANGRRTLRHVRPISERLLAFFGSNVAAGEVTAGRITEYRQARLAEKAAAATVNRELACLRRAFRLGNDAGLIHEVPRVALIEENNTRKGFFEEHQFLAVREKLPDHLRPLVTFMYLTGWRTGEVVSLTWRNVDFHKGTVRLEPGTTKNKDGRVFPFAKYPQLAALLHEQRERITAWEREAGRIVPWVFPHEGHQVWSKWFYAKWWEAVKAAEVYREWPDPITGKTRRGPIPHDFRRTVVRSLERAGVPRSVATTLTGHKTENVYRRYAITAEADQIEGVAKLAASHGRGSVGNLVQLAVAADAAGD
jgi:integrase